MITINLLPPQLRLDKGLFRFTGEFALSAGIGSGFILLVLLLVLTAIVGIQEAALKGAERELTGLDASWQETKQLKNSIRLLQGKVSMAEELLSHSLLWSKKMNEIGDLIQPGLWLTKIELQKRSVTGSSGDVLTEDVLFLIQGRVYSKEGGETAIIGKYIKALKGDENFSRDFGDIRLENIRSHQLGGVPVAEFMLECPLKK